MNKFMHKVALSMTLILQCFFGLLVKSKNCCKFSPVTDVFSLPGQRYCCPVWPLFEQPPIR